MSENFTHAKNKDNSIIKTILNNSTTSFSFSKKQIIRTSPKEQLKLIQHQETGYTIKELYSPIEIIREDAIKYFLFCSELLGLDYTALKFDNEQASLLKINDIIVNLNSKF